MVFLLPLSHLEWEAHISDIDPGRIASHTLCVRRCRPAVWVCSVLWTDLPSRARTSALRMVTTDRLSTAWS